MVIKYAGIKLMAMQARQSGFILEALNLERKCDEIYDNPEEGYKW